MFRVGLTLFPNKSTDALQAINTAATTKSSVKKSGRFIGEPPSLYPL
jgi:hypothetical protein